MAIKEGTNKAIVVNSGILYARLFITTICGFLTTRFALQAMGVVDYGLFSVLGGIVALIDVANAVMINTTTRFMTVAIGRGNDEEINQQFNINLRVHVFTALFSLVVALTVGVWYIHNYLNYEGDIHNAISVFVLSVIGADISMLGVPYNGLISAKENFLVTSIPTVVSAILKMIVSLLLVYCFTQKLLIFASAQCFFTIYPTIVFAFYCYRHFPSVVTIAKVKNKKMYKEVLGFSSWTLYGTAACMAKNQGASIVINYFFTTAMNASLGIANSVNSLINSFAQNVAQPMFPQITKSYAVGDMVRCKQLLCMITKFSYLIILLISSPFLIETEWILGLWLADVPPSAGRFTCLLVIDLLVSSFNAGIGTVVKADGHIWAYEFFGNSLRLLAIIIAYFVLRNGASAEVLLYVYIMCSLCVVIINQIILNRVTKINNMILLKNSYLPSITITILFIPYLLFHVNIPPLFNTILGFAYLVLLIWFIGLNYREKRFIKQFALDGIRWFKNSL